MKEILSTRDKALWEKITKDPNHCLYELLPPQRQRILRDRGLNYILPRVRTERFERTLIKRCLFGFY